MSRSGNVPSWLTVLVVLTTVGPLLLAAGSSPTESDSFTRNDTGGLQLVDTDEEALGKLVTYSRANYVWPYATGPFYGEMGKRRSHAPGLLHTMVGTFDLTRRRLEIPAALTARTKLERHAVQYYIIQLDPLSTRHGSIDAARQAIEGNGGAIVHALPGTALIARMTPRAFAEIQKAQGLLAIDRYHPAFKLNPTIGRSPLIDPIKAVSEVYELDVRIFDGEDAKAIAQELIKLGGNVTKIFPDTVRVEIHRSKLAEVAALEPVFKVFEHLPVVPLAEETTTTVQTGRWNRGATPFHDAGVDGGGGGIDGSGSGGFAAQPQVLMVLDTGIQLDAADLSDTSTSAGTPGTAHRKVRSYQTTIPFGGDGDLFGCDASPSAGFTHGHVVATTALGNATAVSPTSYGNPYFAYDDAGNPWRLDGVAKGAMLVAYDGQRTPAATPCSDPMLDTLAPGDLYSSPSDGSLQDAFSNHGARVFTMAWGAPQNVYDSRTTDIDAFLFDHPNAMVVIAAGNFGGDVDPLDGIPDEGTLGAPAGAKNGLTIGAHSAANDLDWGGQQDTREWSSSTGPTSGGRIAPQLMAPSRDREFWDWNAGVPSEFACRSNDNDQADPVECDINAGRGGTSYPAAAVGGVALLVRDYFAQGFYPDGTSGNPGNATDQVEDVSGALVKAILVGSAKFMTGRSPDGEDFWVFSWLSKRFRFNNEQGYGRVKLDNILPLQSWPAGVPALAVVDGGIPGGVSSIPGFDGVLDATAGETDVGTIEICDAESELRVALAWVEPSDAFLINDLDLELISPSGSLYHGNYFTDDDNRDGAVNPFTEDCPGFDGATGTITESAWSLPVCQRPDGSLSPRDSQNPTEAIYLSPDPLRLGTGSQIEEGAWTIRVSGAGGTASAQQYALVVAGGLCTGSSVRFDSSTYTCNSHAVVTVFENGDPADLDPTVDEVASRTKVQVLDGATVVDEETGLTFQRPDPTGKKYVTEAIILTDGTAPDSGNGVLDVRNGNAIRVLYDDVGSDGITPDPDRQRSSLAQVACSTDISFGNVIFGQFGRDTSFLVSGGCERNARGQFEFGFPDRYMDAGELIDFKFAFQSREEVDLRNVDLDLRCVIADADSPASCRPGSTDCADPYRSNNPSCDQRPSGNPGDEQYMTILDTPKKMGLIAATSLQAASFGIRMANSIPGTPEVEMLLSIQAPTSGKTAASLAVSRHRLDVDEQSLFYSTDFPTGGTEIIDWNENETIENPTTDIDVFITRDYRFEQRVWSDLTAGGTKNQALMSPWNFDVNDGGFRSGILTFTDESTITNTIAQWGEDKNFNLVDDKRCTDDISLACNRDSDCVAGLCLSVEQRDPADGALDKSWNIRGGCGWQTRPPGTCANLSTQGCFDDGDCPGADTCTGSSTTGGIWHTGRIGGTTGDCLVSGNNPGQCQAFETVGGSTGLRVWAESLVTPVILKVNGNDHQVEITAWEWNAAVDLPDGNVGFGWEFDTDVFSLTPVDLFSDDQDLDGVLGPYNAVGENADSKYGIEIFAPLDAGRLISVNGTLGNNREGKNSCFFEGGAIESPAVPNLVFAVPADNDLDDDGDGLIDEFVTPNGPRRNMGARWPDMRVTLLEDLYGDTGAAFQAAFTMFNFEKDSPNDPDPEIGYGIGLDDVVIQWREFELVQDASDCAAGECAVLSLDVARLYEGRSIVTITVLERSPDPANDCDLDGSPDGTTDCDGDGLRDAVVRMASLVETPGEIVHLNETSEPGVYRGELPVSSLYDAAGVLFVTQIGAEAPEVTATYLDNDDGTGQPCSNDRNSTLHGIVEDSAEVYLNTGEISVVSTVMTDNGDGDGFPDSNETVSMQIRVSNKGAENLTGLAARLTTDDEKIDCVLDASISIGDVPAGGDALSSESFVFRVDDVDRSSSGLTDLDEFAAEFRISFSSDQFDTVVAPASVIVDLDLDATGGGSPTTFFEGFESGTFGAFTPMNLDAGRHSLPASDGYRCQYNDPEWEESNSYGVPDCYLGASLDQADTYFWQVHTPSAVDGGKAYSGANSLYMGIFGLAADEHTTPMAVLEAIRTEDPINLGFLGEPPELSFKQQVDFTDGRILIAPPRRAADRGVVHLQLADGLGQPVGDWIKLQPYLNVYDQQGMDNYTNCMFDPVDDGNTESDFFDPADPMRRLGPSSTCFPDFVFARQGDTFNEFSENNIGLASDGPGLRGSLGIGTWVESKFNLERFRGRRARLRFLNASVKWFTLETWEQAFGANPIPTDDGWWIDDVQVTNVLIDTVTITNDDKDNSLLPECGATCNVVNADLTADPAGLLAAPGQVVELSAIDSVADRCLGGVLQYRFWIDGNSNAAGGDPTDTLLRSWTDNPEIVQAPGATTNYVVEVRCSADPACIDSAALLVGVDCPASGSLGGFPPVLATDKNTLDWGMSLSYDYGKGLLSDVSTYTTSGSGPNQGPASSFDVAMDNPSGESGLWYLFRQPGVLTEATEFCNAPGTTWGSANRDSILP
jgi:hypothetical protein